MRQKWNAEIVISAIKELHQKGVALDSTSITHSHRMLLWAALKYKGSWRGAVEAAGIDYISASRINPNRRVWNQELVIDALKDLHKQGHPLHSNYAQTKQRQLYDAACKYFGGWGEAITAAGIDYSKVRLVEHRSWTKESIVEAIIARDVAKKPISGLTVSEDDRGLYTAARRHFGNGGWAKARVLAGFTPIDPDPRVIWTEESVRLEILRFHESGMPLNVGALSGTEYEYVLGAGNKVFGSWAKAIEATGLNYEQIRKQHSPWTKDEVIAGIQALEKQGIRLSSKSVQLTYGSLFGAAVTKFGCWSQAVETAGISYRKHLHTWSTKAWLRKMHPEEYQHLLHGAERHAQTRRRTTR